MYTEYIIRHELLNLNLSALFNVQFSEQTKINLKRHSLRHLMYRDVIRSQINADVENNVYGVFVRLNVNEGGLIRNEMENRIKRGRRVATH